MERIPANFFFLTVVCVFFVGDLYDKRIDVSVLLAFVFLVSGLELFMFCFFYYTVLTFLDVYGLREFLIELLSKSSKFWSELLTWNLAVFYCLNMLSKGDGGLWIFCSSTFWAKPDMRSCLTGDAISYCSINWPAVKCTCFFSSSMTLPVLV